MILLQVVFQKKPFCKGHNSRVNCHASHANRTPQSLDLVRHDLVEDVEGSLPGRLLDDARLFQQIYTIVIKGGLVNERTGHQSKQIWSR